MNSFQRGSQFQNHLITALPNHYACSVCHSMLIYACGEEDETVTCANDPKHEGLVETSDLDLLSKVSAEDQYEVTRNADPVLAEFLRQRRKPAVSSLFGDWE